MAVSLDIASGVGVDQSGRFLSSLCNRLPIIRRIEIDRVHLLSFSVSNAGPKAAARRPPSDGFSFSLLVTDVH
jgi:hypothetical protein